MSQKKFRVVISSATSEFVRIPGEKVSAFNQRLHNKMNGVNREFQRKQKTSTEKAAKIVLNA